MGEDNIINNFSKSSQHFPTELLWLGFGFGLGPDTTASTGLSAGAAWHISASEEITAAPLQTGWRNWATYHSNMYQEHDYSTMLIYHLLSPAMGWNAMCLKRHYSLNNYSVLQSTTSVLLQYYSALQSTIPVRTTLYYKVLVRTTKSTPVLLCTTRYYCSTVLLLHKSCSNITKCCTCHDK